MADATVVIDMGSLVTRTGYALDNEPCFCHSSYVSTQLLKVPSATSVSSSVTSPSRRNAAASQQYRCPYPIYWHASQSKPPKPEGRHCVSDWDAAEVVYRQSFEALNVNEDEVANISGLLLTEPVLNSTLSRERTFEIMFETFSVPRLQLGVSAILALFASGRTTGCVLESGYDVTNIVPIHAGYCVPEGITQGHIGGRDVTNRLSDLLIEQRGFEFSSSSSSRNAAVEHFELVDTMKRENCVICKSEEQALFDLSGGDTNTCFTLPDGRKLWMGSELSRCSEVLFTSNVNSLKGLPMYAYGRDVLGFNKGIQGLVRQSFHSTPESLQWCIFQDVVLCGGNTMIPGFAARLCKELENETLFLRRSPLGSGAPSSSGCSNSILPSSVRRSVVSLPSVPIKGMNCRYYNHLFPARKILNTKLASHQQPAVQKIQPQEQQMSAEISAWLGGSVMASQTSFQDLWTLKSEYEEYGRSIIQKHCLQTV